MPKHECHVKLGDEVKDTITGLKGIAIGITVWLNGCVRIVIQPPEVKDGKPVDTYCCDVEQVEVTKPGKFTPAEKPIDVQPVKRSGGPMPSTPRR